MSLTYTHPLPSVVLEILQKQSKVTSPVFATDLKKYRRLENYTLPAIVFALNKLEGERKVKRVAWQNPRRPSAKPREAWNPI